MIEHSALQITQIILHYKRITRGIRQIRVTAFNFNILKYYLTYRDL